MNGAELLARLSAAPAGQALLLGDGQLWDGPAIGRSSATLRQALAGCRVLAVLADNSPAWVVADLTALAAGIAHLPLPLFFTPAQMGHALAATGADALLTDQPQAAALAPGFSVAAQWQGLTLLRRTVPESTRPALPAGTAKISFTSGSTGTPKGVCLSATGLCETAGAVAERLADLPIAHHLCVLPLALLLENVAGVYAPLLRGAQVHLPPLASLGWQGMAGFDPAALQRSALACGADSVILVPELAKAWTLYLAASGQRAPASLDFVAVGGARVDAAPLQQGRALGLPLYQGYGLTECGSVVCLNRPGDDGDGVGRPLGHVQLHIADGEVVARTRAFLGYLGDDESARRDANRRSTSADLGADPGAMPGTDFATGDLGRFDAAGHLQLDGRRKNLLITSFGRNIAPEWVEAALLAQPGIVQAVVVGDARPCLAALLVPAPGVGAEALAAMLARANAGLPDYARVGHCLAVAPFTAASGLATGNGRPRRAAIHAHYGAAIDQLYSSSLHKENPHVLL